MKVLNFSQLDLRYCIFLKSSRHDSFEKMQMFELLIKFFFSWFEYLLRNLLIQGLFYEKDKRLKICVNNVSARWTVNTDKFTLFVYCSFLVLLSTTVCSQNINKQNVNIAEETLTDYSFLSRYHYTKSKNYLKRRYRIRHWIPMFFGTPCTL